MTGGVVSRTTTSKEALEVRPSLSFAVQVICVVPMANVEPDAGVHVGVMEPSQRSVAVALKVTGAPFGPVTCAVMVDGTVSVGAVSLTLTEKDVVAECPHVSLAVQVTGVAPTGNVEPETGLHENDDTVIASLTDVL
jgi:hypothetical protein